MERLVSGSPAVEFPDVGHTAPAGSVVALQRRRSPGLVLRGPGDQQCTGRRLVDDGVIRGLDAMPWPCPGEPFVRR